MEAKNLHLITALIALIICGQGLIGEVSAAPTKVNVYLKNPGDDGWNIVNQRWVNDETVNIICRDPGYEECVFTHFGSVDFGDLGTEILENYHNLGKTSGTYVIGDVQIDYMVIESPNVNEGEIAMEYEEI